MTIIKVSLALAAALTLSVPAQAAVDALGNDIFEDSPGSEPTQTVIGRDDFGICAVNLNFDELAGGDNSCNGAHIVGQYAGLVFDVPAGNCANCANSFLGGLIPNNSDPNVGYAQQNTNVCSANAPYSEVTFNPPVMKVGMDYFTSVTANFTLRTYTSSNVLIEAVTVVGSNNGGFLSGFAGIDAGSSIIARIEFLSRPESNPDNPFNFSYDDFIYQVDDCATPTEFHSWGRVKSTYRS